jgi:K+-transporting ATPase ATPase A chain
VTRADWWQLAILGAALAVSSPLLGRYLARIYTGQPTFGDRVFGPVEHAIWRLVGLRHRPAQRWTAYAGSMLAFSLVSTLGLYAILRIQHWLPLNPTRVGNVPPALAFNTAVSFVTGTNWQAYAGETTMSHLSQMAGLVVAQFTAAAVGMSVALALIRGLAHRSGQPRLGNFWEDLVRTIVRVLLPIAIVSALVLISQGVVQNLHGFTNATTVTGGTQRIPGGLAASQEVLKTLGTNGGGFYNANSAHPFENPNGLTNLFELFLVLVLPFAIPLMYGRMIGDRRQGRAILAVMTVLWLLQTTVAIAAETGGNPRLATVADQTATATQPGGNLEGKEIRLGPGGVGSGLYAILVYALLAVFAGGLMVGRTPEYLGKKIRGPQMTLVVFFLLVLPAVVLGFSAAAALLPGALGSRLNPGMHGLAEIVYAYASAANGNGSAFAGLSANTPWYNTTLGLAMLAGRYLTIIPVLALAGSLARERVHAHSTATLPTQRPVFVSLHLGIILLLGGLSYLPMLVLGLIGEAFQT